MNVIAQCHFTMDITFHGQKDGTLPFRRHIPGAKEILRSVEELELELPMADLHLGVLRPIPNEGR